MKLRIFFQGLFGAWLGLSTWMANASTSLFFEQAHEKIYNQEYFNIDSLLVYQDGQLLKEHYYRQFDQDSLHRTHSTFKSINALLVLIAIDQGLLDPEERILPLLKRFAEPKRQNNQKSQIQVKHLLNMTSGLDCEESPYENGPSHEWGVDEGPRPLAYALNIPMVRAPGAEWHYCSANSFILAATVSAALARANKPDIFEFAQSALFSPLGIKKTEYRLRYSPDGQFLMGQGNSNFKSTDLAKFGLLVLNKGLWQEKRIISHSAFEPIYNPSETVNWLWTDSIEGIQSNKTLYGYQWYQTAFKVDQNKIAVLHTWGNGGQFIFVIPSLNAVVVFTGSNQGHRKIALQKQPFDIMYRYILPGLIKH